LKNILATVKDNKYRDNWVAVYASIICFLTYASVYAFRKPFTVGVFADGPTVFGLAFKDALVISQVLGYMFSKFFGIKFIAELKKVGRGKTILLLVGISWISMLLFAMVPAPLNVVFLFTNGFPLGIIWGVVFSFVEGRRATDFIGATLAVSFIFSSGFVKSISKSLQLHFLISDWWLPFLTGAVFIIPLLLLIFLLEKIPPPSENDIALRVTRLPLDKAARKTFFNSFKPGLIVMIVIYVFLTVFRDIRDNFAADIWTELGYGNQPSVFTNTEIPITLLVLILIGSMILVKNNRKAFVITQYIILFGFAMAGISSFLFIQHLISPFLWMTLVGLGLYIGYIPFNCILFDRLIATFRITGNVGFLMYLADSFGYMGSVSVIVFKTVFHLDIQWTVLYSRGVVCLSVLGVIGSLMSIRYFNKKYHQIKTLASAA
jgi:MFS family permease